MHLIARVLSLAAASACSLLAACTKPDPTFRAADVIGSDAIVGEWVEQKEDAQSATRLVITADPQPTEGDRLARRSTDAGQLADQLKKGHVPAYVIAVTMPKVESKDDADKPAALTMTLRGYLLRTDGDPVLCLQNDMQTEENASSLAASLFSTPSTLFMGVKVEGDTLTVRSPRVQVSLLTIAQPLDAPSVPADGSSATIDRVLADADAKGGSFYSADPDRVVAVYRRYGAQSSFWEGDTMVLKRVKK